MEDMPMEKLLKVEHIEKYYGSRSTVTKALDDVSFEVGKGEFLGVMGASGSGKSTLLNCISTIDTVSSGHIYLADTDITALPKSKAAKFRQQNLGFIFQDFNLLDTLTIGENIALAPTIGKVERDKIKSKVEEVTEILGIRHILDKFPYQVSGGERQRCACARALICKPGLILADEPTGALDSKSAQMLLDAFTKINRERNATILMVTHDIFSASYCSRILFLRDGKLFDELLRGEKSRREFWSEILDVVTMLGGDSKNVG
jgi:putative ABC transport system ATP-binding protein